MACNDVKLFHDEYDNFFGFWETVESIRETYSLDYLAITREL